MLWTLPGPQGFLRRIFHEMSLGKHVVVRAPIRLLEEGLVERLWVEASVHGYNMPLQLTLQGKGDAWEELGQQLQVAPALRKTPELIIENTAVQSELIFVLGLEQGDALRQNRAVEFMKRAGEYLQINDRMRFQFVFLLQPDSLMPRVDVRLSVLEWWGIVQSIDLELAVHLVHERHPPQDRVERSWDRALAIGLAWDAPELVEPLIAERPTDAQSAFQLISRLNKGSRSSAHLSERWKPLSPLASYLPRQAPPPQSPEASLWSQGDIAWLDQHGIVATGRTICADQDFQELRRRMWLGQVQALLGDVERVRATMVDYLQHRFQERWRRELCQLEGDCGLGDHNPEIGRLHALCYTHDDLRRHAQGRLFQCVNVWREIRNNLAHRRLITMAEFRGGWEKLDFLFRSLQ